jgi:cation:H+ antiporter
VHPVPGGRRTAPPSSPDPSGFTPGERRQLVGLALTALPFAVVLFGGLGRENPLVVAAVTGLAIVAASMYLAWAVEALEGVVSQAVALAVLALIEVAPEYSFSVILAWQQRSDLVISSMTGSNRLLLGLGWPVILFLAWLGARRRRQPFDGIRLSRHQAVEILFLLIASAYAFVIVLRGSVTLLDSLLLTALFAAYVLAALRMPPGDEAGEPAAGIGGKVRALPPLPRALAVGGFLLFGAFVIFFGAEPFIDGVIGVAKNFGISQFFLIQWVAPFLSEFPESLTAFLWAATVVHAPRAMANLVSSKLNQWTLLIASIPAAYSLSLGRPAAMPLSGLGQEELLLTAAQSLLGVLLLTELHFSKLEAVLLLALFTVQFVLPLEPVRLVIAGVYLALAAVFLLRRLLGASLFGELARALASLSPQRR